MQTRRALGLLAGLATSCGPRAEPTHPVGTQFIEVEYPPPPAQIEEVTERLAGRPECSWMDGAYAWQGRRWEWVAGAWVIPPPGCTRAPAMLFWSTGPKPQLCYVPPAWYPTSPDRGAGNRSPCRPATPCLTPASNAP